MHAEYFVIYKSGYREAVKTISKDLPEPDVKPPFTFIIKSIYPVYRSAFMIPSQKEEVLWVFDFICKKKTYCFQALFTPIHIIA